MSEEPLLCAEAKALVLSRFGSRSLGVDRVAEHARVRGHSLSRRSAQQSVDGLAGDLAAKIPQRIVDGANRVDEQARSAVSMQSQQLVVDELRRERIPAE